MTRSEWRQFYRTLRTLSRQGGGINLFAGDFNEALTQAVDEQRRYVLWADGRERRIWYLALSLYNLTGAQGGPPCRQ